MKDEAVNHNIKPIKRIHPTKGNIKSAPQDTLIWHWYAYFYDLATLRALPYLHLLSQVVDIIELHIKNNNLKNPKIMDACCGTGNFSRILKTRIPDSQIEGIDSTTAMIKRARKKCNGVGFEVADIKSALQRTPSASVDVILLINGFYALPDQSEIIYEISRVLKKRGLFILSDPQENAKLLPLVWYHLKHGAWKEIINLPLCLGALAFSAILQYGYHYTFLKPDSAAAILRQNQLQVIDQKSVYANQNYLFVALGRSGL